MLSALLLSLLVTAPSRALAHEARDCGPRIAQLARRTALRSDRLSYSLDDWRANIALNARLVIDPYAREALDIISTILVATHDLPNQHAAQIKRFVESTRIAARSAR